MSMMTPVILKVAPLFFLAMKMVHVQLKKMARPSDIFFGLTEPLTGTRDIFQLFHFGISDQ